MHSNFSYKSNDSSTTIFFTIINQLAQRVLKALKNEFYDDLKFTVSLNKAYKDLVEHEKIWTSHLKISDTIKDLVSYCNRNFALRSSSNERRTPRKRNEKTNTARTPNFNKLDRIIEESPKVRSSKKSMKRVLEKKESSSSIYYENMMSKYLKMTLKTPVKVKQDLNKSVNQVQLTDGMFFRLF